MNKKSTRELVRIAADKAMLSGKNPTVELIRKEIGQGSHTTITDELKKYRISLIVDLKGLEAFPDIPVEIAELLNMVFQQAYVHGKNRADAVHKEVKEISSQLDKKNRALVKCKEQNNNNEPLINSLNNQIVSLQKQVATLESVIDKFSPKK